MSSDVWQARIDLCVDKDSKAYWIMLRLRNTSGNDKRHMSILLPKSALTEALEHASRLEEKGLHERQEELVDSAEPDDD